METATSSWNRWVELLEQERDKKGAHTQLQRTLHGGHRVEALYTPSTPGAVPTLEVPWRKDREPTISLSLIGPAALQAATAALTELGDRPLRAVNIELAEGAEHPRHAAQLRQLVAAAAAADVRVQLSGGSFATPNQALLDAAAGKPLQHSASVDPWAAAISGALEADLLATARADAATLIAARSSAGSQQPVIELSGQALESRGAGPETLLAFGLSALIEALRDALAAGVSLDDAADLISWALPTGRDTFVRIAMLRAARLLSTKVLAEAGASDGKQIRLIATDDLRSRTMHDRWVNQLRTTSAAFAGIVAGADEIRPLAADALAHGGSLLATRIALQAPIILLRESWLAETSDPAAGSWMIDSLTSSFASRAWQLMNRIEADGGLSAALASEWLPARIAEEAAARQQAVSKGESPVLGTTSFPWLDEPAAAPALAEASATADAPSGQAPASAAIEDLRAAASAGASLQQLINAVTDGAQTASKAAGQAFELHEGWRALNAARDSEPWEALRARSAALGGVSMLVIGDKLALKPRSAFAQNWVNAAGFRAEASYFDSFDAQAIAAHLKGQPAGMALLIGADAEWPEWARDAAEAARGAGCAQVWAAGRLPSGAAGAAELGIDALLHLGADALSLFDNLISALEAQP